MSPKERSEMINVLELKTRFSEEYLMRMSNEKLLELYEKRVLNG